MFKKLVKNERGLTLIELLAVVVILGIIAAIAIPSIGGMINNSREDAHIANAKQIADAARLFISTGNDLDETTLTLTLDDLIEDGLIEEIDDPSGDIYDVEDTVVTVDNAVNPTEYVVTLIGDETGITYTAEGIDAYELTRENIALDGTNF